MARDVRLPGSRLGASAGAPGQGRGGGAGAPGRARRRLLPLPRHVSRVGKLLILALIVEYLVIPQIAGTRKAVHLVSDVNPLLLLSGLGLEGAALLSYAKLSRSVLPKDTAPSLFTLLRIQLTTLSVSHCVPGGTAAGSPLGYRLMTAAGVRGSDVGFALAAQGLGSALVLNALLWVALVVSIPIWGFSALYLAAAVVGLVLMMGVAGLVVFFLRGERWAGEVLERIGRRLSFVDPAKLRGTFSRVATRIRQMGSERAVLGEAIGWAAANWLLDAASLWVFVGAFGHWVDPDGLLVAYGLANVLAAIPITPGGLGVVEATLSSTLVGFGTPRGVAILGVIGYRLVNFWLPIPVGGLTYLSLHVDSGNPGEDAASGWERLARRLRRHRAGGEPGRELGPGQGR